MEGAVGCFLICLILCWLISSHLPLFGDLWGKQMNLWHAIALSLTVSLLELFPLKYKGLFLNDNLYVPPLVALFAMYAI